MCRNVELSFGVEFLSGILLQMMDVEEWATNVEWAGNRKWTRNRSDDAWDLGKGARDVGTRRRRGLHLRDISQGTGGLEGFWLERILPGYVSIEWSCKVGRRIASPRGSLTCIDFLIEHLR